jgi:geranylgeranyl diphosphate synthase type II
VNFDLTSYWQERADWIDVQLEKMLPQDDSYPPTIHAAMRYSVLAGGKRLRPILTLAAAEAVGETDVKRLLPVAGAIECIHTYSLIHDDLPAMDNDDWRRGKATNHKVFGEAVAILAGDALLTFAFEALAQYLRVYPSQRSLQVIAELAQASGSTGMVGGQTADVLWEKGEWRAPSEEAVDYIHYHKTAKLIIASVRTGALLAGASARHLDQLTRYAARLGLAFQITDDLLDIFGEEARLGKQVQKDAQRGKLTYPSVHGVVASQQKTMELLEQARQELIGMGSAAEPLRAIAMDLAQRDH